MFGSVTLSPNSDNSNNVFNVNSNGNVNNNNANNTNNAVRPAITLSSEVKLSGSGTQSDPYVVS